MSTRTADLFAALRGTDEAEAERAVDVLLTRIDDVWPALEKAIADALTRDDDNTMHVIARLTRVFTKLPAPLDGPLLFVATSSEYTAQHFVEALLSDRVADVAESALRFVVEANESERNVGVVLLARLVPRTGALRYLKQEAEVVLPPEAEPILLEALAHGVDSYVIAQLLIRHGWATDDASSALHEAVVAELERDAAEAPDDHIGIGYDLGCDLQVVATSFQHAGDAARPHLGLFDRMYLGGDAPLRSVLLESITGIGGERARGIVDGWASQYEDYAQKLRGAFPGYELGFRVGLEAAHGLLEGREGVEVIRSLLPESASHFYAQAGLAPYVLRVHALNPEGLEWLLHEASASNDAEVARVANAYIADLRRAAAAL